RLVFAGPPAASGDDLLPTSKVKLESHAYAISFEFRPDAKRDFETLTRALIGKPIAILMDDRLISAPMVNDAIPGAGIIMGRFTRDEANLFACELNSGPLPMALKVVDSPRRRASQ